MLTSVLSSSLHQEPRSRRGDAKHQATAPEAVQKKARTPKVPAAGLEAAFRKRQNVKLRSAREQALACKRARVPAGALGARSASARAAPKHSELPTAD